MIRAFMYFNSAFAPIAKVIIFHCANYFAPSSVYFHLFVEGNNNYL